VLTEKAQTQPKEQMQIQVHTDHNTDGREKVIDYVRGVVEDAVSHFSDHITRVEVHLGDENGTKAGSDDKRWSAPALAPRCMMEARVEKRHPIAVTHHAATMGEAIDGAAGKLKRLLAHELERLHEQRHPTEKSQ
jgi:ribosome-associated translation inhibitor RaiA